MRSRTSAFILLDNRNSKVKNVLVGQNIKQPKLRSLHFDFQLKNSVSCNPGKLTAYGRYVPSHICPRQYVLNIFVEHFKSIAYFNCYLASCFWDISSTIFGT